jgi:hypothetical protein
MFISVILLSIFSIRYRDFEKAFLANLSLQATSFIGQEVTIGDLSFSPAGEIILHNIIVQNPEGFSPGRLLYIEQLSLKVRYKEFLKQHFSFDRIAVMEPELTLVRNREGTFNISDKLREFIVRNSTLEYRIDEFIITSGSVDFNGDRTFRNDDVNLSLKNLSSVSDAKTSFNGHTTYAGSKVAIDGWVYLKNEPKRLNISVSSPEMSLSALKELNAYGVEITKTKATFHLNAEGDTEKGFHFTVDAGIKDAKFAFLKRNVQEIRLKLQAFLNIPDKMLILDRASLTAGGVTAVTLQGELKGIQKDLSYDVKLKIKGLDLSAINFLRDMNIGGILNSDVLRISGSHKKPFPALSGSLELRDGLFQAGDFSARQINADITFSAVDAAILSFAMKDMKYRNHAIPWMEVKSGIVYHDTIVDMKSPVVRSDDFTASAALATIKLPVKKRGDGVRVEMKSMHASYPVKGMGMTSADFSITLNKEKNVFSGDFGFSAHEVMVKNMRTGFIKGRGNFDEKSYSVDISQADISGGRIRFAAEGGRTSGDIFPVKIMSSAENINIEDLYSNISEIVSISYPRSGHIQKAVFEATVESSGAVQGSAEVEAEKITVAVTHTKRTIIKEGILKAGVNFKGKDLDFIGDAKAGKLSARISGAVNGFSNKDRQIMVHLSFPEVKALDVRETLWDIFPDSLLYTGLDGSLAADISVRYSAAAGLGLNGKVLLSDLVLDGENGEYSVGPIRGELPVLYTRGNDKQSPPDLPSFERGEFKNTRRYFAEKKRDDTYNLISLGTMRYGFQLLDNVNLWIRPEGKFLHIDHFSGNIFGGTLNGSAIIDIADLVGYKAGFLIEGLSLAQLCDRIEPIRGYISGNVDGIATVKGEGGGLPRLIGKADFWTYSTPEEKTEISKEFLQKVGGLSLQGYLGDRRFDKGIMSLYLQGGYIIFRELELSNRNVIGMKDLDIKVAPLNNRIAIDHLMWSITEAAYRAEKK